MCIRDSYGSEYDGDAVFLPEPYRGYKFFDPYTPEQIQSLRELLIFWRDRYNIPLDYREDMWDVSQNALEGQAGVWSHTSFRYDKSDLFPQDELVTMLKSL